MVSFWIKRGIGGFGVLQFFSKRYCNTNAFI